MKGMIRGIVVALIALCIGCLGMRAQATDVIFDTDANNALDDQMALAYLLLSDDTFSVRAVTTCATSAGGPIALHDQEAARVLALCCRTQTVPLLTGAQGNFDDLQATLTDPLHDGYRAVDGIISEAHLHSAAQPLTLIAVGKLTNVALALAKDPSITHQLRVVWLGSNYPEPGEYNLESDTSSVNYLLNSDIRLEIVPARYRQDSGTWAVQVTIDEACRRLSGQGPKASPAIEGRNGGQFTTFGDYAVHLFRHSPHADQSSACSLFDLATVAIVKQPAWAKPRVLPAPILVEGQWMERPDHPRTIILWEHFDRDAILSDFFDTIQTGAAP